MRACVHTYPIHDVGEVFSNVLQGEQFPGSGTKGWLCATIVSENTIHQTSVVHVQSFVVGLCRECCKMYRKEAE